MNRDGSTLNTKKTKEQFMHYAFYLFINLDFSKGL